LKWIKTVAMGEYQLLDDTHVPDGRSSLTASAAAYGIYPSIAGVVKPYGLELP
jgi:hypothetical protein